MSHALEPDHLSAVSALLAEQPTARRGLLLGAAWGLGHALTLLLGVALFTALGATAPLWLLELFELAVAAMLLLLGVRALAQARRLGQRGPYRVHQHGGRPHGHAGPEGHLHLGRWTLARRPLLVGMVHGLAGSGSLATVVLAGIPAVGARLLYVVLFSAGSVLGMALLAGLLGAPLGRFARSPRAARCLVAVSGAGSVAMGLCWGVPRLWQLW